MMDQTQYDRWWIVNTDDDGMLLDSLPEPIATLAAHVVALQGRIDDLPDPDIRVNRCACAYDHPQAECFRHRQERLTADTEERDV